MFDLSKDSPHSYLFPPSYSPWLATRLPGTVTESLATCDNCSMVKPEGLTRDPGPFLAHLKCCTYFPFIPNFNIGAFPEEKATETLSLGILLPIGLYPTAEYQILSRSKGAKGFGQAQDLLCPFFNSTAMACSIWNQRPGVCTSYFCKSSRGASGLQFWADIEKYLNHFEWKLARDVFFRLGLTDNELAYGQGAISLETEADERGFFIQAAWGKWQNKKLDFFKEATKIASQVSPDEIGKLLDPEFLALEKRILQFIH